MAAKHVPEGEIEYAPSVGIHIDNGRICLTEGKCKGTVILGRRRLPKSFLVLETDAFDAVLGEDFFEGNLEILYLGLQSPRHLLVRTDDGEWEKVQVPLFVSYCFPPWFQTKRTCALQILAGLVSTCQTTPFSLHNLFFSSPFILSFFLSAIWLRRRVCLAVGLLLQPLRQLQLLQCLCQFSNQLHVCLPTRLRRSHRTSTRLMSTDGLLG